jgi:hypothetical protein
VDAERYGWLLAAVYGVVALIATAQTGAARLSSRPLAPAETLGQPVRPV